MTDDIVAQLLRLKKDEEQAKARATELAKEELAIDALETQKKDRLGCLQALLVALQSELEPYEAPFPAVASTLDEGWPSSFPETKDEQKSDEGRPSWPVAPYIDEGEEQSHGSWVGLQALYEPMKSKLVMPDAEEVRRIASAPIIIDEETRAWLAA